MSGVDHDKLADKFGIKRSSSPDEIDHDKLAKAFGVQRGEKIEAKGGYFGALAGGSAA
jgi:hypothetical protein